MDAPLKLEQLLFDLYLQLLNRFSSIQFISMHIQSNQFCTGYRFEYKKRHLGSQSPYPSLVGYQKRFQINDYEAGITQIQLGQAASEIQSLELIIQAFAKNQKFQSSFYEKITKGFPNLISIWIVLHHRNLNSFIFLLSQLKSIQSIELIIQSDKPKVLQQWTEKLPQVFRVKGWCYIAEVIKKQSENQIPESIIDQFSKLDHQQWGYTTRIDLAALQQCSKIEKWGCENLRYGMNETEPNAIKYMKDINFQQLKCINLFSDGIETVEGLTRMRAPLLQKIFLQYNQINKISSLSKLASKNINGIWIHENLINQDDSLWKSRIQCLDYLCIQYDGSLFCLIESIAFAIKLQFTRQSESRIHIEAEQRLNQLPKIRALIRKHPKIHIRTKDQTFTRPSAT